MKTIFPGHCHERPRRMCVQVRPAQSRNPQNQADDYLDIPDVAAVSRQDTTEMNRRAYRAYNFEKGAR